MKKSSFGALALAVAGCAALGSPGGLTPGIASSPGVSSSLAPGPATSPESSPTPGASESPTPQPTATPKAGARANVSVLTNGDLVTSATSLAVENPDHLYYTRSDTRKVYWLAPNSMVRMGRTGSPGTAVELGGGGNASPLSEGATVSLVDFDASGVVSLAMGRDETGDRVLFAANGDCAVAIPDFESPTDDHLAPAFGFQMPTRAVTGLTGCGTSNKAHAVATDTLGNLLVGTDDGVTILPLATVTGTRYGLALTKGVPAKIGSGKVVSLTFDRMGTLHIGYAAGSISIVEVAGYTRAHGVSFSPVGLAVDNQLQEIAIGPQGQMAVVAGYFGGFFWNAPFGGDEELELTLNPAVSGARSIWPFYPGSNNGFNEFYLVADKLYKMTP